jgi:hypothetical protein
MIKYAIVGLSGKRGSGKDALASRLVQLGWERISFADELKKKIRQEFGLSVEQTDGPLKEVPCGYVNADGQELCPRDIMTLCGKYYRSVDPMFWVKQAFRSVKSFTELYSHNSNVLVRKLVVTDVRFKNEVKFLKDCGAFMVRISRLPELNVYKTPLNDFTETGLDNYNFDYDISQHRNVNFKDLEREAKTVDRMFGSKASEVTFNL